MCQDEAYSSSYANKLYGFHHITFYTISQILHSSWGWYLSVFLVKAYSFERLQRVVSGWKQLWLAVNSCEQLWVVGSGCEQLGDSLRAVESDKKRLWAVWAIGSSWKQLRAVGSNCSWPNIQTNRPSIVILTKWTS